MIFGCLSVFSARSSLARSSNVLAEFSLTATNRSCSWLCNQASGVGNCDTRSSNRNITRHDALPGAVSSPRNWSAIAPICISSEIVRHYILNYRAECHVMMRFGTGRAESKAGIEKYAPSPIYIDVSVTISVAAGLILIRLPRLAHIHQSPWRESAFDEPCPGGDSGVVINYFCGVLRDCWRAATA